MTRLKLKTNAFTWYQSRKSIIDADQFKSYQLPVSYSAFIYLVLERLKNNLDIKPSNASKYMKSSDDTIEISFSCNNISTEFLESICIYGYKDLMISRLGPIISRYENTLNQIQDIHIKFNKYYNRDDIPFKNKNHDTNQKNVNENKEPKRNVSISSNTDVRDIIGFMLKDSSTMICNIINDLFDQCVDLINNQITVLEEYPEILCIDEYYQYNDNLINEINSNFIYENEKITKNGIVDKHNIIYVNLFDILNIWIGEKQIGNGFIKLYQQPNSKYNHYHFCKINS